METHTVARANGDVITRAQALADLVWRNALGYSEPVDDHNPEGEQIVHRPATWAIQLVYDRIEGKVGPIEPEKKDRKLASTISQMGKATINSLALPDKEM